MAVEATTEELVTEAPEEEDQGLPVFGLPGSNFYVIHIAADVSLAISIMSTTVVLIYMLGYTSKTKLFQRPIGERLVVYLGFADLFYSISHILDHTYMLVTLNHPPDAACVTFAFFVQSGIICQSVVVLFTAINAMVMVVLERKISLGPYDWRLFILALGIPFLIGFAGAAVPFIGPSGAWCLVDMRPSYGGLVFNIYAQSIVAVFAANLISYGAVWIKITQVANKKSLGKAGEKSDKYHKTAKMMMLFVGVYLFQWASFVIQAIWGLIAAPQIWIFITTVITANLGGFYNGFAYTIIRKKYASVGSSGDKEKNTTKTTDLN